MAKNQVTLTFAGESKNLEQSFDRVEKSGKEMGSGISNTFDKVGDAGGKAETSMLGLGAGISGVSTIMSGDAGPEDYAMAIADLGDSIEHFVIPAIKKMSTGMITAAADAAKGAATHAVAAATTVAGWVASGAAALVAGAQMALAWLIGLGPIALVIVAIVAIIGILVALGVGFDDIARIAGIAWQFIQDMAKGAFNWLKENWPLVLAILAGPFGLAVLAIVKNWDTIKEKAGAALNWIKDTVLGVKDWIVARFNDVVSFVTGLPGRISSAASGLFDGFKNAFKSALNWIIGKWNGLSFKLPKFEAFGQSIGGNTISVPQIPKFHGGGTFSAPPGRREGLAMLLDGEKVSRPGEGGAPTIIIDVSGSGGIERELWRSVEDAIASGRIRVRAA